MLGAFWTQASTKRNELTRLYEPIQPFILLAAATQLGCRSFLDIGANIGFYSVLFAVSDCVEEVHAFEASSAAFAELQTNIRMNALENTKAHHLAVTDHAGEVTFMINEPLSGINAISGSTFHDASLYSQSEMVGATTLDDMFSWENVPTALKIDVEGHEPQVIIGASRFLTRNPCVLQLECYGAAHESISSILGPLGYERKLTVGHDVYFAMSGALTSDDMVRVFERAATNLVQSNLGKWPVHSGNKEALQVSVRRSGGSIRVDCEANRKYFDGQTEYAFYLRKDGQKSTVLWYSNKASAKFTIPEDEYARYAVSAFCRDPRFPNKKVMVTVAVT